MDSLVTILIGHRGTGKTSFLSRVKGMRTLDLDDEMSRLTGKPIREIFNAGEPVFRQVEREVLERLVKEAKEPTVIAVGAGFEGPVPAGVRTIWLRRLTDSLGRCFFNRPRLNPGVSPFAEYRERFFPRDRRFAEWADEELFLPEGYEGGLEDFLGEMKWSVPYDITLLPENFRGWPAYYERRKSWGVRSWEIRDDLLSPEQIALALKTIPHQQILYSRRTPEGIAPPGLGVDWALELGNPSLEPQVTSLHESDEFFESALGHLARHKGILKMAEEVASFAELEQGHIWWLKDPSHRAFLPRSPDGRWRWYRSLFGPRMPIHYIREGQGSSLDQPMLWQTQLQPRLTDYFAAVVGHPVSHSRSPLEHRKFFEQRGIPFVSIDIQEDEFTFAMDFLRRLGLRYAAVTSPHKKVAWALAQEHSSESRRSQSANTLYFKDGKILAHNTDVMALHHLRSERFSNVWLWGGGGIKSSVKEVWPNAREIPAREGVTDGLDNPDLVIWATGRSRDFVIPPLDVRPSLILDLNYGEDSPGLEWAVRDKINYESGLKMFKLQAEYQREFWEKCEK